MIKWYTSLCKKDQIHYQILFYLFGVCNSIFIAMKHNVYVWYFIALWIFISVCNLIYEENKLYLEK